LFKEFMALPWDRAYDVLEYVADNPGRVPPPPGNRDAVTRFKHLANLMLEREHAGYRFVNGVLTEITAPVEIEEITRAVERARETGLDGVHHHITSALELLGKRPEPDHRNAIKEAISAVESATKLIGNQRTGALDPALDALSLKMPIHPAMKAGFSKLYGFTSDGSGIRHALLDAPTVDAADARFMIVACSAFVNWLIVKADAAGLLGT
jgi:hypothetical protein